MNSHIRSYKEVRDKFTFRDSDMDSTDTTVEEEDVVEEEEDTSEEDAEDSATLNTVLLPVMLGSRK